MAYSNPFPPRRRRIAIGTFPASVNYRQALEHFVEETLLPIAKRVPKRPIA